MTTPPTAPVSTPAAVAPLDEEAVFSALGNEKRRKLLLALADGQGKPACQLVHLMVGRTHDAALKHLTELREARLVQMAKDPTDARRQLYTLTAAVKVVREAGGLERDFGCCVWRVRGRNDEGVSPNDEGMTKSE